MKAWLAVSGFPPDELWPGHANPGLILSNGLRGFTEEVRPLHRECSATAAVRSKGNGIRLILDTFNSADVLITNSSARLPNYDMRAGKELNCEKLEE